MSYRSDALVTLGQLEQAAVRMKQELIELQEQITALSNQLDQTNEDVTDVGASVSTINSSLSMPGYGNWNAGCNADTMMSTGNYWVSSAGTNFPRSLSDLWGLLQVVARDDTVRQTFWHLTGIWTREYQNGSWKAWRLMGADLQDVTFGSSTAYSLNIDTINNSVGYIYRCINSSLSGTLPLSVIGGGNGFLLIGFSGINTSNSKPMFGVQLAIGFGGNKIAIRNAAYNASGGSWSAWRQI